MAYAKKCELERCGREFVAQLSSARFCSGACRAAASRERRGLGGRGSLPSPDELEAGSVTEAVFAQFGPDVTDHWAGVATVALAKYLDWPDLSGSALVSISKEFRAYLALLESEWETR